MWLCGIFSYANKCESQNEVPQSCIKFAQGEALSPKSILVVGWHLVCHFAIFTLVPFANGPSVVEVLIESCLELIKTKMCDNVAHFYYMYIRLPQIVETTVANRDGGFTLCQVLPNDHYNHYLHNEYVEVWQGGA